jgi:hypothetical protein
MADVQFRFQNQNFLAAARMELTAMASRPGVFTNTVESIESGWVQNTFADSGSGIRQVHDFQGIIFTDNFAGFGRTVPFSTILLGSTYAEGGYIYVYVNPNPDAVDAATGRRVMCV